MKTADTRILTGARWSSAVLCARRAVYEHADAPRDPISPRLQMIFRRGHTWGVVIREDMRRELAAQGRRLRAELEIPWPRQDPIGVGHADIYLPDERHMIEVLSTAGDLALPAHKALQVAGYVKNHRRAENATVLVIDRATGDERAYPIDAAGLAGRVTDIEHAVIAGIRHNEMPARAAEHPGAHPCAGCVFNSHCWAGWAPEPPEAVPHVATDAELLADAEDLLADRRAALAAVQGVRDEIRDRLRPYIAAGRSVTAGAIDVKRTVYARRSFSLSDYTNAGHTLGADAEAFTRESEIERWSIRRLGDQ